MNKQAIETVIDEYRRGNVSGEAIDRNAYELNEVLGNYLYETDKQERPEGTMAIKERIDDALSKRRVEAENARMEKQDVGQAKYSKHT